MMDMEKYKLLSLQFFGSLKDIPSHENDGEEDDDKLLYSYLGKYDISSKGPLVDLSDQVRHHNKWPSSGIEERPRHNLGAKQTRKESGGNSRKAFWRCFICYTKIIEDERVHHQLFDEHDLPTFVDLLMAKSAKGLNSFVDEQARKEDDVKTKTTELVNLKKREKITYLCSTCSTASRRFVRAYHGWMKLEEQISELRAKFRNAIKLSTRFAAVEVLSEDKTDFVSNKIKLAEEAVDHLRRLLVIEDEETASKEIPKRSMDLIGRVEKTEETHVIESSSNLRDNNASALESEAAEVSDLGHPQPEESDMRLDTFDDDYFEGELFDEGKITDVFQNINVASSNSISAPLKFPDSVVNIHPDSSACAVATTHNPPRSMNNGSLNSQHAINEGDSDNMNMEASSTAIKELGDDITDANDAGAFSSNSKKQDTTTTMPKRGRGIRYYIPKGIHNPTYHANLPPEKLSNTRSAVQMRELRAQYPKLSKNEIDELRRRGKPKKSYSTPPEKRERKRIRGRQRWAEIQEMYPGITQQKYFELLRKKRAEEQKTASRDGVVVRVINGKPAMRLQVPSKKVIDEDGQVRIFHKDFEIKRNEAGLYFCGICEDSALYKREDAVKIHINSKHLDLDLSNAFECEICGKKFYYQHKLTDHLVTTHKVGNPQFQCDLCGEVLQSKAIIYQHKRVVHDGIKPHVCEHCGKAFGRRKDMLLHVRRHTGERPFVCHVCADAFFDKQTMKQHIRRKHPEAAKDLLPPANPGRSKKCLQVQS